MIRTLPRVAACALASLEAVPAQAQYCRADFPPEENLYRKDVVALTADGVENCTAFPPFQACRNGEARAPKGIVQTLAPQALP